MSYNYPPSDYTSRPYTNTAIPSSYASIAGPSNSSPDSRRAPNVANAMSSAPAPPPPASATGGDAAASLIGDPHFEIFDWYPAYQSCQRYFVDHAQYDVSVQAVAALMNICLPFQRTAYPIVSSTSNPGHTGPGPGTYQTPWQRSGSRPGAPPAGPAPTWVSLVPYLRRLVVTGFDREGVLHGFFGDDWRKGVGPLQECERRNYLFAAKSVGWAKVKYQYDMNPHETVPFMKPLQDVPLKEIENSEQGWSQWLAMEDWMLGDRAPAGLETEQGNVGSNS